LVLLGEDSPRNNYVAQAYSELYQKNVVLKILLANTHELEMLKFYNGNGYVQLLDCDIEKNAFLLELVTPGISLRTFFPERDEEATCIIAQLIKKLQSTDSLYPTHCFKNVSDWLKLLDTFQSEKIPKYLLQKAQILYKTLIKDMAKLYLLHGDLHSGNILLRQEKNNQE
jgi:streptomycin 6-kinase